MAAPDVLLLLGVNVSAIGRAFGRLEESQPNRGKVPTSWLRAIHDLVEIGEPPLTEMVRALAERSAHRPGWCERAIVTDGDVARAEIERAVGGCVVNVQRAERRHLCRARIAEDREVELMFGAQVVVQLGGIVLCEGTPMGFITQDCQQAGARRATHNFADNRRVERAEEEDLIFQLWNRTAHVETSVIILRVENLAKLVDIFIIGLETFRLERLGLEVTEH